MSEVCQDIGANPGSPNVPTWDRGSGMGVAKVRCAATRPELRKSGGKVTWRVGRQGVGDGEVVRKKPEKDMETDTRKIRNEVIGGERYARVEGGSAARETGRQQQQNHEIRTSAGVVRFAHPHQKTQRTTEAQSLGPSNGQVVQQLMKAAKGQVWC
ncbi:uncharacterized protein EI90DRAFT_3017373 [Cantharellus anzutake]|uniref:uncharacterized protein n=1 Tax=Cantharellus anzutake TaxID=1750568 RepID=UPI001908688F|nr:uncharacterized protein EI90DRAFT_3017373 [Cantharellus anzutake]KAF8329134.1 hypothetical protein EI90DRAFT_3017373 [Cantharellus anzutake]